MLKHIRPALLCVTLFGCGESDPEVAKLVPVSGKVALDGQPLTGATVFFTPHGQTPGTGAFGSTDTEGKYTLMHRSNQPGIQPGEYIVSFSKLAMPDGSPIPEGKTAADVEAVEHIPKKYTLAGQEASEQSTDITTVPESGGTFDFELTSK